MTEEDKKVISTFEGKLRHFMYLYDELKQENAGLKHLLQKKEEEMTVFILSCDGSFALQKRPEKGLLAGLWQFPNCRGKLETEQALQQARSWGLKPKDVLRQVERSHIFTHIRWDMRGIYLEVAEQAGDFTWLTAEQIEKDAALPTAFRQFWDIGMI